MLTIIIVVIIREETNRKVLQKHRTCPYTRSTAENGQLVSSNGGTLTFQRPELSLGLHKEDPEMLPVIRTDLYYTKSRKRMET